MSENEGADAGTAPGADEEDTDAAGDDEADAADASDELVERVEERDAEELAGEIAGLRERAEDAEAAIAEREERIEDLESKLKRKQADFENYKKRTEKRRERERKRATEDLVERLLDVRDNLKRALDQNEGADIRDGVESTLRQFDGALERENVEAIEPEPGSEVDPQRHEVLMRVESDRPEGTIDEVHRPGYEMAGKVLRAAQVTVSE